MKKLIIIMTAMAMSLGINAQNSESQKGTQQGERKEFNPELYQKRMREFVVKEAKLTNDEQTKFFPMLDEMLDKQHKLMQAQRELMKKGRKSDALSEADYENIVTQATDNDVEMKRIEQTYYKKFHSVLTWKKTYAVRQALSRFQMEALRHFQPGNKGSNGAQHSKNRPQSNNK